MIQNIWLSSVANPAGAAALVEEALRIKYQVTTMGPVISEHVIQSRHMQELQPKIKPHDLIVPAEQDMQEVLSLVNPRQLPNFFLWVESAETYHPKNLQSLPCPKAAYFIHGQQNTAEKISWASQFDYVFLTQRNLVKDFKAAGISNAYWLPPGFSPVIHKQTSLLKKHEVSFVGTVNKGSLRESLLARVKERFPLLIKQCFLEKMAEVFSQSKIVLNYSEQSEINRRIFEVMGTGSFLLTNRAPGSGIDEIFTDGEELAFFDQDDLCEKIGYYLDRGFIREKIAARGNAMVKNGFTFAHRCEDMVAVIEGRKNDTPDPAELRSRSKAVVTVSGGRAHKEYSLEEILQYDPGFPQGRSFIIPVLDLKSQTEYTFHTLLRDLEEIEGDVIAVFNSPAMADLFKGHPRITYSASISHNVGVSRAWNIGLDIA
ncbi:MAG: glycosyltransferase, partial [Ignavibacteriales bacterium]|nr:glycosyltransferase [Ignavibacteriales bacterium]